MCSQSVRIRDKAFVMAKRNYKVHANLGLSNPYILRKLPVLDTRAAPNLFNSELGPLALRTHIYSEPGLDFAEANKKLLTTVGYIPLVVRLGTCMAQLEFLVCYILMVPDILCFDSCHLFVEAMRTRAKNVEVGNGFALPIVQNALKRAT